jgi:hypothetical protein
LKWFLIIWSAGRRSRSGTCGFVGWVLTRVVGNNEGEHAAPTELSSQLLIFFYWYVAPMEHYLKVFSLDRGDMSVEISNKM